MSWSPREKSENKRVTASSFFTTVIVSASKNGSPPINAKIESTVLNVRIGSTWNIQIRMLLMISVGNEDDVLWLLFPFMAVNVAKVCCRDVDF